MAYCPKCGSVVNEENFCQKCGTNLTNDDAQSTAGVSSKSRLATLLLAIFLGGFGVHRFYVGKIGTGILQLILSATGIGEIWQIIDAILVACGEFKDSEGNKVLVW